MMQLLSPIATLPHQNYVLSLLQTSFSVSWKCVGSVIYHLKSGNRLKRTSECCRPSEKNAHTPPNPGRDPKYVL